MKCFKLRMSGLAFACLLAATCATTTVHGQGGVDRVRRQGGIDSGKIASTSVLDLTISKGGVDKKIPAEEIIDVYYSGEPSELNSARQAAKSGRFQEALGLLAKIPSDGLSRKELVADVQFYKAVASAGSAQAGQGDLAEATAQVGQFLTDNPSSFHVPAAIELLGDLHLSSGQYAQARKQYAKLGKAPKAYFQLKSALLLGRVAQAQDDHQQALAEFDKVVSSNERGPMIEPIRLAATLDQAVSQAAVGDADDSAAAIRQIIAAADPDEVELLARAYQAMGDAQLEAGNRRAALHAYLHVDLLFSNARDIHAEALEELVALWKEVGQPGRSSEAAAKLAKLYPNRRRTP